MRTWSIPNQIKDPVLFCGSLFWDCSLDGFHWACKHSKQLTKHSLDATGILSLIVAHILDYARTWLANVAWWRKRQINAMAQSRILSILMVSKACSLKGLTISAIAIWGWAILVVLSWVCCYCHSRYYFVLGKRSFCPRRRAKLHLELPGKHIPTRTLLVTLSHIIKHEKHGDKARSILGCIWANNYSQLHAEYVKLSLLAMSILSRNGNHHSYQGARDFLRKWKMESET